MKKKKHCTEYDEEVISMSFCSLRPTLCLSFWVSDAVSDKNSIRLYLTWPSSWSIVNRSSTHVTRSNKWILWSIFNAVKSITRYIDLRRTESGGSRRENRYWGYSNEIDRTIWLVRLITASEIDPSEFVSSRASFCKSVCLVQHRSGRRQMHSRHRQTEVNWRRFWWRHVARAAVIPVSSGSHSDCNQKITVSVVRLREDD